MKKLVLIALFAALCLSFSNAYDSYSNESLIVIPDGHHKYKKRRHRDRYDDVVIYMDPPYGRYKQSDRGRDYRDKLIDQYIKNNNIKKAARANRTTEATREAMTTDTMTDTATDALITTIRLARK